VVVSTPATSIQYNAYGASTTVGYTLSNPSKQAYPSLVAAFESVPLANRAISGDQACDVAATQIFPNGDSPALTAHTVSSTLIGTNDVDVYGTGSYEAIYMLCDRAIITWLGVPLEYKVLANGANATTTGSGKVDSTWNAWTTGAQGATISFTITTSSIGPIYAWPLIDDQSSATYSYSLDGVVIGTNNVQTSPNMATQNGTSRSLGFIRIPAVSAGTHVVKFTQTSTGSNGVSVVGVGSPFVSVGNKLPTVLVGTITYQLMGASGGACTVTDAPCQQYVQDQKTDAALLAGDGLDVRVFDTRQYMFGTASEMNDALHPNALGQQEISQSVEAVW
jgi:lysophospholipase L1-like esterase